jgi:protein-L-isoaspartate(D-aspartate) O-methyltransferase
MVTRQLVRRGIADPRVVEAFRRVPRALFVRSTDLASAYEDRPLPIGGGQTISQPYIVGLMTQELDVQPHHRVLDVGTGSGYQAALLARLAGEVHTIERLADLSRRAAETLGRLGLRNVHFHVGDGTLGWPRAAPYDRVLVAAAAPEVPAALSEQLADGGRLILPLGGREQQVLTRIDRHGERFERTALCDCIFVPLIGEQGWGG